MSSASLTAGVRTAPVLWTGGAICASLIGVALAAAPLALIGGTTVVALVWTFVRQPRWMLVAVIALLWSYAGWVVGNRTGASDIAVGFLPLLVLVLVARRMLLGEEVHLPRVLSALLVLGAAWALSLALAYDIGAGAGRVAELTGWILLVALMVSQLDTTEWYRRALWAIAISTGLLALLTLFQALTGSWSNEFLGFAKVDERGAPRSSGPLQPNNYAQILLVAGPLAWFLALSSRSAAAKLAGHTTAAACALALVFTGSRGGILALAVVVGLIIVVAPVPRRRIVWGAVAAVAIALVLVPAEYSNRVQSITGVFGADVAASQDTAVRGRASENLAALRMFADHPVLGVGVGNYPVLYQTYSQDIGLDTRAEGRAPHSLYLESLAETGIVGTLAMLWVLALAVRGPLRARAVFEGRDRLLAEGALVATCGYLAAAVFLHGAYPRYLWIVVGIGLTAGCLADAARRPARTPGSATRPHE